VVVYYHLILAMTGEMHVGVATAVTIGAAVLLHIYARRKSRAAGRLVSHSDILTAVGRAGDSAPIVLVDEPGALVYLLPSLLSYTEQASLFESLRSWGGWNRAWDDFGEQTRLTAYCGEPGAIFSYVGLVCQPQTWPSWLGGPLERVNRVIAGPHGTRLTGCLLNNYEHGQGHIPWHSDEVRAHGDKKLIVALSTGGVRSFHLRRRMSQDDFMRIELPPGSALVMAGATQSHWEHALPLEQQAAPHRISLTFRSIEIGCEVGREPPHCITE